MFRVFIRTTLRNLSKNTSYVLINLLGLSLSLAVCIVAYLNFDFTASFDRNHTNFREIFKIHVYKDVQGNQSPYGITPLPLGYEVRDQLSGVQEQTRYTSAGLVLKKGDNIFNERVGFADPSIFNMFSFPFMYGSAESILDESNIILSYETSKKYYGEIDPVGEIMTVIDDNGNQFSMRVGGVLLPIPTNSSIQFGALAHINKYMDLYELDNGSWENFVGATFLQVKKSAQKDDIVDLLNANYVAVQNSAREDWKIAGYYLEPLSTLGVRAGQFRANWLYQAPPKSSVYGPFVMAILMLLIACFNFTNTSIAISSKRLKEIGMRKVLGGTRRQLIVQFMGENILLSLISLLVAIVVAVFLVPAYSAMWEFIDIELNFSESANLYWFLIIILLFTSIVSGLYPSVYISSYQPVNILKGDLNLKETGFLTKSLLTIQFGLTFTSLIGSIAFSSNAKYQSELDVGFAKNNIIAVRVENNSEYERYKNRVVQNASIEKAIGSDEHIGFWSYSRTLRSGENEIDAIMMDFGLEYDEVMDLTMVDGRFFLKDLYEHDRQNSIVVSETLAEEFGWENPVGRVLQFDDSTRLTVVGVVKDFYMYGFWDPVEPMAFRLADKENMNFVIVKAAENELKSTYDFLEKTWYEVEPNKPFNGHYQDEFIANSELVNKNIQIIFFFIGLLALILTIIGLFTLVSLNVIKRTKEIGIRKALGAPVSNIILILNRQFIWILSLGIVIGIGLSLFLIDTLISSIFYYYQGVTPMTIIVPVFIILVISLFTSSSRIFATARQNPVLSLRYE